MEKNGIYEGTVCALGTDGEGIIHSKGATVFVPFCLTGEKVVFKALKVKGNIAYGKAEKLLSESSRRAAPPCSVFYKCGGCALQHMNYAAQLEFKRNSVEAALKKIGGIEANIEETVPCASEYRYRNKLSLPIGVDGKGNTVCGFYAPHSKRIIETNDCLIQSEWVKNVISAVKQYSKAENVPGYDEEKRTGVLRRIVVREMHGKFIFALIAARRTDVSVLIKELEKTFADFTFLLNVNKSETNGIFGGEWHICRGLGFFEAEEFGIKYKAGANTFLQVNDDVRAKLYARVLEEADEGATALDLYSGGGMLTAMLAKKCGRAYGIEIVKEASACADELAEANGLKDKMFNICGAVEDNIEKVFAMTDGSKRVIVCDPPRKGMERSVVNAVARSGADKIILVSCNPATLARDLGLLTGTLSEENGAVVKKFSDEESAYQIDRVTPFDMFPQTKWAETLVVLSKKNS